MAPARPLPGAPAGAPGPQGPQGQAGAPGANRGAVPDEADAVDADTSTLAQAGTTRTQFAETWLWTDMQAG